MIRLRRLACFLPLAAFLMLAVSPIPGARADWPERPVRLVTGFTAGGLADLTARLLSAHYEATFGKTFVVENRAGAGGIVGTDYVAKAAPDGYTLLFTTAAVHGTGPNLYPSLPYDPVRDFTHVARIGLAPIFLFANVEERFGGLAGFAAAARLAPGGFSYGSPGPGSLGHLTGELIKLTIGAPLTHVPYKGAQPALTDLLGRQTQAMVDNLPGQRAMLDAGRVEALAVATEERLALLPKVPTFKELGYPEIMATAWVGLCGPAGLPPALIERLSAETRRILRDPELRGRLFELGLTPDGTLSPAEQTEFVRSEIARWGKVVREAGIRLE